MSSSLRLPQEEGKAAEPFLTLLVLLGAPKPPSQGSDPGGSCGDSSAWLRLCCTKIPGAQAPSLPQECHSLLAYGSRKPGRERIPKSFGASLLPSPGRAAVESLLLFWPGLGLNVQDRISCWAQMFIGSYLCYTLTDPELCSTPTNSKWSPVSPSPRPFKDKLSN